MTVRWTWAEWWRCLLVLRPLCRLGWHNVSCRGRRDHDPHAGRWVRVPRWLM